MAAAPHTELEQKVYACVADHSSEMVFDALDREFRAELRTAIRYAIDTKNVDGVLEFLWNHDLLDPAAFGLKNSTFEELMAVMRVRLETLVVGYYAITPKIRAFQERQAYDLAELRRRIERWHANDATAQPETQP